MTDPADGLRALTVRPSSPPPPVEALHERVEGRRRRRIRQRMVLAGVAAVVATVALVPLVDQRSDRPTQVVAGPDPAAAPTTTTLAREFTAGVPSGTRLDFQVPEGWTTLFALGDRMLVATRPLTESDQALALLARDDVSFGAFPADGVVVVVGGDPTQAKYQQRADGSTVAPGPAYGLGDERLLAGGVRVRRGDLPQSGVRIASYAGPAAPASRRGEAEDIAAGLRLVRTGDPSVRPPPPPPGSRPGLPQGTLPVPEAGLPEVARFAAGGSTLVLVAGSNCAYLRWVDAQPELPGHQPLTGGCTPRPSGTGMEDLNGALPVIRVPGMTPSTVVMIRIGTQVREVSARLADGATVAATIGVDGWALVAAPGRIVALTGTDAAGQPVPAVLVN